MFHPRVGRRSEARRKIPEGVADPRGRGSRPVEPRGAHGCVPGRDPEAVRELYREYGRLVYAVAHRVLGRRDLAEDAVQQTFVNAWQAADRFDVTRDPASWLATIAQRSAIDIYRREQRRPASELALVATDDPAVVSLPPDLGSVEAVWHMRSTIDRARAGGSSDRPPPASRRHDPHGDRGRSSGSRWEP